MNITRADTKRGNMVREIRKQKKSADNKKSSTKESKHKIKRIKNFFKVFFFEQKLKKQNIVQRH